MSQMIRPESAGEEAPAVQPVEFEAFFEAEYARLARALYLVTGDPGEAEDLAQEALVQVYERWDRVQGLQDPTGYLYRTALNLHRSRLRRLTVRARRLVEGRSSPDPALGAEVRDELGRALASLPDGQREAVVLVGWVGLTAEEAGRLLGINPVSIRVRLSRARAALRKTSVRPMSESDLDPVIRNALARRAERFRPTRGTVEGVFRKAHRHQRARRAATAVLALGLFAATAGVLLPRLLATAPPGTASTPVPGPSPTDEGVFFPTGAREDGYRDWAAGGTLVEDEGCVFLRQEDGSLVLVLWPHGWSIERRADGTLRILDDMGAPVVEVGDQVTLGGGPVGRYPGEPPEKLPEEIIGEPIPGRCTADGYFRTSGVLL